MYKLSSARCTSGCGVARGGSKLGREGVLEGGVRGVW